MAGEPILRPATEADVPACFAVFQRALLDYFLRLGMASEAEAADRPVAATWDRQKRWIIHLWETARENWVAIDGGDEIIGWALTVERGGHDELAIFFVDPRRQEKGVGQALLLRAFPDDGRIRTIVATQDVRAMALYLRSGLSVASTSVEVNLTGTWVPAPAGLSFEPLGEDGIGSVAGIEEELLRLRREVDIRFLIADRPGWIARRAGRAVGYAFGRPVPQPGSDRISGAGPMGALDPADMPALIDHVIASVPVGEEFSIAVPLASRVAVAHLLSRGARIDPFYFAVLTSRPEMKLDRYVHTSPAFIL